MPTTHAEIVNAELFTFLKAELLWLDFPKDRRKAVFLFLHVTPQMSAIGTKQTC
jgi:hypothetical protein